MTIPTTGGKKRDRVETMMTSKRSSPHRSYSSGSSSSQPPLSKKKHQPQPQDNDDTDSDDAEYERAVAILREFHSRRVVATRLHSVSLESILEADSFEDVLAGDFALALSVGKDDEVHNNKVPLEQQRVDKSSSSFVRVFSSSNTDFVPPSSSSDVPEQRPLRRMIGRTTSCPMNVGSGLSRMKKTVATKCLVDLDDDDGDDDDGDDDDDDDVEGSSTPYDSIASSFDDYGDYYVGHYVEDEDDAAMTPPMTKRRRSLFD